jgi:hypothetical protein
MGYEGKEKRKYQRTDIKAPVYYRVFGTVKSNVISQARNISHGGFYVSTDRRIRKGTVLALEVMVPAQGSSVKFLAKVLDSVPQDRGLTYGTRLEFLAVDEQHMKLSGTVASNYSADPRK